MKKYVLGMSMTRQKTIEFLDKISPMLVEHVCKLILYRYVKEKDVPHWNKEIATVLAKASGMTLKPDKKKLKRTEYEDHLFGDFGDEITDLNNCLWLNQQRFVKEEEPYPEIDIDSMNLRLEYVALQKFIEECCNALVEKEKYDTQYWTSVISRYLN